MSDLEGRLARLTPAQRQALAEAWGLPRRSSPPAVDDLAVALTDPLVVKRRLAGLIDRHLDVLDRIDRADHPPSARGIAVLLDRPVEDLTPDLRQLSDLLLIRRAPLHRSTPAAADPADLPIEIRPALRSLVHQVLAARRPDGPGAPPRRAALAASGAASLLLAELIQRGGRAPAGDLIDRLGPDAARSAYLAALAEGQIEDVVARGIWWLIVRPAETHDAAIRAEGTALLWDLLAVIDQVEREPIDLAAGEWTIPPAERDRLTKLLRGSEAFPEARLHWIIRLAVGVGLAEPAGRSLTGTGRLAEWAGLGFAAQARRVVDLWRDDLAWAEPKPPGRWGAVLERPRLRTRLIDRLRQLAPGEWVPIGDLARSIAALDEVARRGRWLDVSAVQVQALVRTMIELPLAWLGLVAVRAGDPAGVALTDLGARVLASDGADVADPDPTLIVQSDREIVCLESPPGVLARVLRASELIDAGPISLHRLTREAVWEAIDRGETSAGLTAFLQAQSRHPVPEAVMDALSDWAGAYRAITVRPVTLVAFDPPGGLDALPAEGPLRLLLEREIAPGLAVLRPGVDFAALRDHAREAGFRLRRSVRP